MGPILLILGMGGMGLLLLGVLTENVLLIALTIAMIGLIGGVGILKYIDTRTW